MDEREHAMKKQKKIPPKKIENKSGFNLRSRLELDPVKSALSLGLVVAMEIYLMNNFSFKISPEQGITYQQARLLLGLMTALPLWIINYIILSVILRKR